jgi:hypothetical protein
MIGSAVTLHHQLVPQLEQPFSRQVAVQAQGAVPLSQLPVWTLPDDNSGLDALLHSQVCLLLFFAA